MADLPLLALSVRQPWAYCIVAGWKPIENRSWRRNNPAIHFRGPFAVHASQGMTRDEYQSCADLCASIGHRLPPPADLLRGGIVGAATITDIVTEDASPWFFGPKGLLLADTRPIDFVPVGGRLGFFDWRSLLKHMPPGAGPVPPAKWMLPKKETAAVGPAMSAQERLF